MNRTVFALYLLGGFELSREGVPVDLPWSSQRLLGLLALQERALPRQFVAASLWPDTTDVKASANLRTALWRLHQPEFDLIDASNGQLTLRPSVWVDVRSVREAARELRRSQTLAPDDLLLDVRGELMPGCWDGWLVFERERLRQEVVQLCEASCAACLADGDHARAVLYALTAVECDPLRESANVWLLRAHLLAGNRSDAMRHAGRYIATLDAELGIGPPPIVDELLWAAGPGLAPARRMTA